MPKPRRPRRRKPKAADGAESVPAKAKAKAKAKPRAKKKAAAKRKAHPSAPSPPRRKALITVDWGRVRVWGVRLAKVSAGLLLAFLLLSNAWVIAYRYIDPPITPLMWQRALGGQDGRFVIDRQWVSLDAIAPIAQVAVLAAEDQRFPDHRGFDMRELQAAVNAYREGQSLRGASTISQQTAKNAFLFHTRSFGRKGVEAYFTALIEFYWGKERILEVYLNIAEWGDGIYGIERAAQVYYGKSAAELTAPEAALLASALPNPLARNPAAPNETMRRRQAWILQQVHNLGYERFLEKLR